MPLHRAVVELYVEIPDSPAYEFDRVWVDVEKIRLYRKDSFDPDETFLQNTPPESFIKYMKTLSVKPRKKVPNG